jgi:hypothetical protein
MVTTEKGFSVLSYFVLMKDGNTFKHKHKTQVRDFTTGENPTAMEAIDTMVVEILVEKIRRYYETSKPSP